MGIRFSNSQYRVRRDPLQRKFYMARLALVTELARANILGTRRLFRPQRLERFIRQPAEALRGPPTKVLQLFADAHGAIPDNVRQACQFAFNGMAPAMPPSQLESWFRQIYESRSKGALLHHTFSSWNVENTTSASFATVMRATLKDGNRPVCVKILYPGIEQIIDSDLTFVRDWVGFISSAGQYAVKVPGLGPWLSARGMIVPTYAKRMLGEIRDRCREEVRPREEAQRMNRSFSWYRELLQGVEKLPHASALRKAIMQRIPIPTRFTAKFGIQMDEPFQSIDASLELRDRFGFIHPLAYNGEHGLPDLSTDYCFVMDYIPGRDSNHFLAGLPKDRGGLLSLLLKALAEKLKALGLLSLHPHTVVPGDLTKTYSLHSDIHPGNSRMHLDRNIGLCLGIMDFGNTQTLTFQDSHNLFSLLEHGIRALRNQVGGRYQAKDLREWGKAYVRAGIVDTPTDPAIEEYLIPIPLNDLPFYK